MNGIPIYDLCRRFVTNEEIPEKPFEKGEYSPLSAGEGKSETLAEVLKRLDAMGRRLKE